MSDDRKQHLFTASFAGAAFFYCWAILSMWLGPSWRLTGGRYMLLGVVPAFLGVLCTIAALALHLEIRDGSGPAGSEDR